MENFIPIQKYASLHRQSIHTVLKKTMNGELKSIEQVENGRKVLYIKYDAEAPVSKKETIVNTCDEIDYKKAYEDLNKEYLLLKTKYQKLIETIQG